MLFLFWCEARRARGREKGLRTQLDMGGAPCRAKSMRSGGSKQQEEEAEAYMAVAARGGHGDAVKWL